jgi:hypothetical protein
MEQATGYRAPVRPRLLLMVFVVSLAPGIGGGTALAGEDSALASAEAAIAELTASMPSTMVPVQGGGQYAESAACDGVRSADALAAKGEAVEQAYGGTPGGAYARIVILDTKKDAKRFFKLITNDDAEACIVATTEVGLSPLSGGAAASADLERGTVEGVKGAVLLEGTITLGGLVSLEYRPTVRRGKVVIQAGAGEFGASAAGIDAVMQAWFVETADRF